MTNPVDVIGHALRKLYISELSRIGRVRHLRAVFDTASFVDEHMSQTPVFTDRRRLLRHALDSVTVDGLHCEFGVHRGESINFIAKRTGKTVIHGFDSFEGLPNRWHNRDAGTFKVKRVPRVRGNVQLHRGWFQEVLPRFLDEHSGAIAFLHMDADLYSSTKTVLNALAERIVPGTVIVFDEFFNYPGWREGEFKAFTEFATARPAQYEYLGYCETHEQVALRIVSISNQNGVNT